MSRGHVQFQIRYRTFFTDPRLYVVLIVCQNDGTLHQSAFLIPSADIPQIATLSVNRGVADYHGNYLLEPVAEKLRHYAVPIEKLATTVLERLFSPTSKP